MATTIPPPATPLPISKSLLLDRTSAPYWAVKRDYKSWNNRSTASISIHELQTKEQATAFLRESPSNYIVPRRWFHSFMPSVYWESSLGVDSVSWEVDE